MPPRGRFGKIVGVHIGSPCVPFFGCQCGPPRLLVVPASEPSVVGKTLTLNLPKRSVFANTGGLQRKSTAYRSAWKDTVKAAEEASEPGKFTEHITIPVGRLRQRVLLVRRLPVVGIATLVASKGQNLNFAVSTNAIAEGLGFKYTNPPAGVSAPPPGISQGLDIPSLVEGSND